MVNEEKCHEQVEDKEFRNFSTKMRKVRAQIWKYVLSKMIIAYSNMKGFSLNNKRVFTQKWESFKHKSKKPKTHKWESSQSKIRTHLSKLKKFSIKNEREATDRWVYCTTED